MQAGRSDEAQAAERGERGDLTLLLAAARGGDSQAVHGLYALLYADLRRIAHGRLRQAPAPALLDTTSLVHESFLRLASLQRLSVNDREHFLAYAARAMRSVVVDLVREAASERAGGDLLHVTLDTAAADAQPAAGHEVLAVHEALQALAGIDPRLVQVVELRYFVGLEMSEIAGVMGLGKRSVERLWEQARSFLYASLKAG